MKFKKYENVENFNVKLSQNRAEIIDDNIVLKIEKHFENEKLILIEKGSGTDLKGRRILYEYK